MLPGLLFSNTFSRAIKYEIKNYVIEDILVIPIHLNIHRYSVDLCMSSRYNGSQLGELSGDSGDFAIPTEFEGAGLTGQTVLFQSQRSSLCLGCSHHSFVVWILEDEKAYWSESVT